MSKRTLPRYNGPTDGDQVAEFLGPDDEGWSTTTVLDWIGVCPDLGPTAYRLYMIVRSLLSKYGPVRKLTLTELCKLLPGPGGKPSSLTRVRDAIRELTAVGLFTTPEGDPLTTSSSKKAAARALRIRVNDKAPKGYAGHRSAYTKLAAIRAEDGAAEGDDQVSNEPGRKSDQDGSAGRKSDPPGRKSDPPGRKSDHDSWGDLQERDPSIDLSNGSSLSSAGEQPTVTTTSAEVVTEERESSAAREDNPSSAPAADTVTQDSPQVPQQRGEQAPAGAGADGGQMRAAEGFLGALPGRLGRATVRRLAPLAAAAFADGYTPETLRAELGERVDVSRIQNRGALPGLYERALGDLPPASSTAPRSAGGRERCPDHPSRYLKGCLDCALAVPA